MLEPAAFPAVIKVGSAVLAGSEGGLDAVVMRRLATEIAELLERGGRICLVSSGAISAGMGELGLQRRPQQLEAKQALAAVGQVRLMSLYAALFAPLGRKVAQVLLTHEDLAHRDSFLNAGKTLARLMKLGILPVINENDTVSTREIQFGDNDQLAVLVANLVEARSAIFLSAAAGLMDLEDGSRLIPEVNAIDRRIFALARGGNSLGSGGMGSKLMALHKLNLAGKNAWLADGRRPGVLSDIFAGRPVGTFFRARPARLSSKHQWMVQHLKPHGRIEVDEGAFRALLRGKASLLCPGITAAEGHWRVGQLVGLSYQGKEFARGMARLDSEQVRRVVGESSARAGELLGASAPRYVVHRNDIALVEGEHPEGG